jgi:hypothetical protein
VRFGIAAFRSSQINPRNSRTHIPGRFPRAYHVRRFSSAARCGPNCPERWLLPVSRAWTGAMGPARTNRDGSSGPTRARSHRARWCEAPGFPEAFGRLLRVRTATYSPPARTVATSRGMAPRRVGDGEDVAIGIGEAGGRSRRDGFTESRRVMRGTAPKLPDQVGPGRGLRHRLPGPVGPDVSPTVNVTSWQAVAGGEAGLHHIRDPVPVVKSPPHERGGVEATSSRPPLGRGMQVRQLSILGLASSSSRPATAREILPM